MNTAFYNTTNVNCWRYLICVIRQEMLKQGKSLSTHNNCQEIMTKYLLKIQISATIKPKILRKITVPSVISVRQY